MGFLQKAHSAVALWPSRFPVDKESEAAAAIIHTKVVGSHTIDIIHSEDACNFSNAHKKNYVNTKSGGTETSLAQTVDAHDIEIIRLAEAFKESTLEDDAAKETPSFPATYCKSDLVVVLDVDRCLVYYSEDADNNENHDDNSIAGGPMWMLRPGLISFLKTTMARYETHVFTAGTQDYAEPLLDVLCALVGLRFAGRWYREHCTQFSHTHFAKDLKETGMVDGGGGDQNRTINMARIVAVDDNLNSFVFNPSNGIPIAEWTGDGDDLHLKYVTTLLKKLEKVPDVRPILQKKFELNVLHGRLGPGQIVDS